MLPHTDAELGALLGDLESDGVARKESWQGDAPTKGRQAVCAFANDLPGHGRPGVLSVGATDAGEPSGLTVDDRLLLTLANMRTDGQIVPPPTLTIEKRRLQGADLAVVTVRPSHSPPVRYGGRTWIHIGPRRGLANAQDERILNERRRHRDLPFDAQPVPSSTLMDLSRVYFEEEYLPAAFAPDVLDANDRSYEQRLAALKMISSADDPTPTVLGLLVLGRSPRDWLPGAYVQFLRIRGQDLAEPIQDTATIDGAMGQVMRRVFEKLDTHNRVAVDITSGPQERRTSPYPRAALQQLACNAIMHRAYEGTNAPVRVTWFDDRIEISSPGGPYGAVTAQNFGKPGVTDYRNPNLAEALRVLGYVQRFGVGIALAQRELQRNGNLPAEFQVDSHFVMATVRKAENFPA